MKYVGCDFHTRFQQIAMVDESSGELVERRIDHCGKEVEGFYGELERPVVVGIESTGYSIWLHEILEELGVELRVGDAAKIRAARVRKKKNDREDARLILKLLVEERFPQIWVIDPEGRDLRQVLSERTRLVRTRTRVKNALQSLALNHRLALGPGLFTQVGRAALAGLRMRPHAQENREELCEWLDWLDPRIQRLDELIEQEAEKRAEAVLLMSYPGVGALTALATVLILGPVERFPGAAHVSSYLGLVPSEYSSAARRRLGRISKQGSTLLRYLMVEAGHSASRSEPHLKRTDRRLVARRGLQIAKTAVARKLCEHLYILLREGIDYTEFRRRGLSAG